MPKTAADYIAEATRNKSASDYILEAERRSASPLSLLAEERSVTAPWAGSQGPITLPSAPPNRPISLAPAVPQIRIPEGFQDKWANSRGPEPVVAPDITFWQGLRNAVAGGNIQAGMLENIQEVTEPEPGTYVYDRPNYSGLPEGEIAPERFEPQAPAPTARYIPGRTADPRKIFAEHVRLENEMQSRPGTYALQRMQEGNVKLGDMLSAGLQSGVQNYRNMGRIIASSLAGRVAGALTPIPGAGSAGASAGAAAASYKIEYNLGLPEFLKTEMARKLNPGASYEELQQVYSNLPSDEARTEFLTQAWNDPEVRRRAEKRAHTKAAVISAADAAFAALGSPIGRRIVPGSTAAVVAKSAAAGVLDMLGESGGELASQLASGTPIDKINWGDITLEGISGGATIAATQAVALPGAIREAKQAPVQPAPAQAPVAPRPAQPALRGVQRQAAQLSANLEQQPAETPVTPVTASQMELGAEIPVPPQDVTLPDQNATLPPEEPATEPVAPTWTVTKKAGKTETQWTSSDNVVINRVRVNPKLVEFRATVNGEKIAAPTLEEAMAWVQQQKETPNETQEKGRVQVAPPAETVTPAPTRETPASEPVIPEKIDFPAQENATIQETGNVPAEVAPVAVNTLAPGQWFIDEKHGLLQLSGKTRKVGSATEVETTDILGRHMSWISQKKAVQPTSAPTPAQIKAAEYKRNRLIEQEQKKPPPQPVEDDELDIDEADVILEKTEAEAEATGPVVDVQAEKRAELMARIKAERSGRVMASGKLSPRDKLKSIAEWTTNAMKTGLYTPNDVVAQFTKDIPDATPEELEQVRAAATEEARINANKNRLHPQEEAAIQNSARDLGVDHLPFVRNALKKKAKFAPRAGWEPVSVKGVREVEKMDGTKFIDLEYKVVPYRFHRLIGDARASAKNAGIITDRLSNAITREVKSLVKRAQDGDKSARAILRNATWYRGVTAKLMEEFGDYYGLFSDLLGAMSPNNAIEINWAFAITALKGFGTGKYTEQLKEFKQWIDDGNKVSEFPQEKLIRIPGSEKLFGINSRNAMLAMIDHWYILHKGSAPKAREFSRVLRGLSKEAIIDIWMGRALDRFAGYDRVPPHAEGTITGKYGEEEGQATGQYGIGQQAFRKAVDKVKKIQGLTAEMLDGVNPAELTASDLQAILWENERQLWIKNGWSPANETSSFFEIMKENPRTVFQIGFTIDHNQTADDTAMITASEEIRNTTRKDQSVNLHVAVPTLGGYGLSSIEKTFNQIIIATQDWSPVKLTKKLIELADKTGQDSFYISRMLKYGEKSENERPGLEISMEMTPENRDAVLGMLEKQGFGGYTTTTHPTDDGKAVGIRVQYIPEFAVRFAEDGDADAAILKSGDKEKVRALMDRKAQELSELADEIKKLDFVKDAKIQLFETVVFTKEMYKDGTLAGRTAEAFGEPIEQRLKAVGGRGPSDAVSVEAVHFGHQEVTELRSDKYADKGKKHIGGEFARVMRASDTRLRHRIYAYVDSGKGVRPERGLVGNIAYRLKVDNLYDGEHDPKKFLDRSIENLGDRANDFETKVLDAGYDGYVSSTLDGSIVLLGERTLPVSNAQKVDFQKLDRGVWKQSKTGSTIAEMGPWQDRFVLRQLLMTDTETWEELVETYQEAGYDMNEPAMDKLHEAFERISSDPKLADMKTSVEYSQVSLESKNSFKQVLNLLGYGEESQDVVISFAEMMAKSRGVSFVDFMSGISLKYGGTSKEALGEFYAYEGVFGNVRRIVRIFEGGIGNRNTVLHELVHAFTDTLSDAELKRLANRYNSYGQRLFEGFAVDASRWIDAGMPQNAPNESIFRKFQRFIRNVQLWWEGVKQRVPNALAYKERPLTQDFINLMNDILAPKEEMSEEAARKFFAKADENLQRNLDLYSVMKSRTTPQGQLESAMDRWVGQLMAEAKQNTGRYLTELQVKAAYRTEVGLSATDREVRAAAAAADRFLKRNSGRKAPSAAQTSAAYGAPVTSSTVGIPPPRFTGRQEKPEYSGTPGKFVNPKSLEPSKIRHALNNILNKWSTKIDPFSAVDRVIAAQGIISRGSNKKEIAQLRRGEFTPWDIEEGWELAGAAGGNVSGVARKHLGSSMRITDAYRHQLKEQVFVPFVKALKNLNVPVDLNKAMEQFGRIAWAVSLERYTKSGKEVSLPMQDLANNYLDEMHNTLTNDEFQVYMDHIEAFFTEWNSIAQEIAFNHPSIAPFLQKLTGNFENRYMATHFITEDDLSVLRLESDQAKKNPAFRPLKGGGKFDTIAEPLPATLNMLGKMVHAAQMNEIMAQIVEARKVGKDRFDAAITAMGITVTDTEQSIHQVATEIKDVLGPIDGATMSLDKIKDILRYMTPPEESETRIVGYYYDEKGARVQVELTPELKDAIMNYGTRATGLLFNLWFTMPTQVKKTGTVILETFFTAKNLMRDLYTARLNTYSEEALWKYLHAWINSLAHMWGKDWGDRNPLIAFAREHGVTEAAYISQKSNAFEQDLAELFGDRSLAEIGAQSYERVKRFLAASEVVSRATEGGMVLLTGINKGRYHPGIFRGKVRFSPTMEYVTDGETKIRTETLFKTLTPEQKDEVVVAEQRVSAAFHEIGVYSQIATRMMPFFSAQIAGLRQSVVSMRRNKAKYLKSVAVLIVAQTLVHWWRNKDKDWYKDQEPMDKYLYWQEELPNGAIMKIPKPFEAGQVFGTTLEALLNELYMKDKGEVLRAMAPVMESLMPFETGMYGAGAFIAATGVPGQTLIEQLINKDIFRNSRIVRRGDEGKRPEEQYIESHPPNQRSARSVRAVTAASRAVGASPARMSHLVRSIFGSAPYSYLNISEFISNPADWGVRDPSSYPIMGGFFRRGGQSTVSNRNVAQIYEDMAELHQNLVSAEVGLTDKQAAYYQMLNDAKRQIQLWQQLASETDSQDTKNFFAKKIRDMARRTIASRPQSLEPIELTPEEAKRKSVVGEVRAIGLTLHSVIRNEVDQENPGLRGTPEFEDLVEEREKDDLRLEEFAEYRKESATADYQRLVELEALLRDFNSRLGADQ